MKQIAPSQNFQASASMFRAKFMKKKTQLNESYNHQQDNDPNRINQEPAMSQSKSLLYGGTYANPMELRQ